MSQQPEIAPNETVVSNEWAIVELMGHVRHVGLLGEETRFGTSMGVVFEPKGDGFEKVYFSGASVYRIRQTTEEEARTYHAHLASYARPMLMLPGSEAESDEEADDDTDPFADD